MTPWKRTLIATSISTLFSVMGFSFVQPFFPLYIQHLGVHGVTEVTLWAALLSGGTAISMAIASPFWGVMADRYGRKIMVVRAAFSAAIILALMGLAQNVYQLLFMRFIQGIFTGTMSAGQALVSSQSPKDRLGFSLGVMQTSIFFGNSVGPLLGGLLVEALGYRNSFLAGGVMLLVAAFVVLFFASEERTDTVVAVENRPSFREGIRDVLGHRGLPAMIGALFAVQFGVTVVMPILPQFVQYLQGSAGHAALITGFMMAAAGVAGAISSLGSGSLSDRLGYKNVLVWAAVVAAIVTVPQYFVTATWQLVVLRVAMGLAMGAMMPAATALAASLVPAHQRGAVYGVMQSANSLGFAAGPMTAAGVVAVANIRAVFLTAAVLLAFIAFWVATKVETADTLATETEAPMRKVVSGKPG